MEWTKPTVNRALLRDLHDASNAGHLAVGMVEECKVSKLHRLQVIPSDIVANA